MIVVNMYMELVRSATVKAHRTITNELLENGVILTPEQDDAVHDAIWTALENLSNGEYQHYN